MWKTIKNVAWGLLVVGVLILITSTTPDQVTRVLGESKAEKTTPSPALVSTPAPVATPNVQPIIKPDNSAEITYIKGVIANLEKTRQSDLDGKAQLAQFTATCPTGYETNCATRVSQAEAAFNEKISQIDMQINEWQLKLIEAKN